MPETVKNHAGVAGKARFGAFTGVFVPTVLTILGIILFLRIGWVVGQSGLLGSLVIIAIATLITLITALSLSAIATNMHVRTGGAYYMISRTLGLEIGGAIGIPLFLSQAISVAFYLIGFTEAFTTIFPGWEPKLISTSLAVLFGALAFVGADFILKIQFVILAILAAALLSFFSGGWSHHLTPALWAPAVATAGFWQVFAIFFPAVTGIMVGVSMSGDLRDPAKDIPRGTLLAIAVTCGIYLATAICLARWVPTQKLLADTMIMQKIARWPLLIILGVWVSTLSSALGSVLAAPRTLEAISRDRAVPRVLGNRLGSATEPRLAVLVTAAIAIGVIWLGNLDFVAPIITMFFLNTYAMINLTAGLERLVGNPSFRPQIKVPWFVSLIGAAACYGVMFLINSTATSIAIIISYGIFLYLGKRSLSQDWGDLRAGIWFTLSRFGLSRLETERWHMKNWRPNIIVFSGLQTGFEELLEVGAWLGSGRGIISFFHLLVGAMDELAGRGHRMASAKHTQQYLREQGVVGFAECVIVNNFAQGVLDIVQAHGIAGLEPNTVLMGWSQDPEMQKSELQLMRHLVSLQKSVLFLHYNADRAYGQKRQIDIWWRGRDRNAELMVLLAHIIRLSRPWEGARIRVIRLLPREEGRAGAEKHLTQLLRQARVEAEPLILVSKSPDKSFPEILRETSQNTDLVFLGIRWPEVAEINEVALAISQLLQVTASAILVRSGEVEDILDTEE
jgi:amino acid transporter